jgi:hypothetical protein
MGAALDAKPAGDIDDPAGAACRHPWRDLAAREEDASQSDLDHPVEIVEGDLRERCLVQDAGAVDEDVDASGALGERSDGLLAAQVDKGWFGDRAESGAALPRHLAQPVRRAVSDDERRAGHSEGSCDRTADTSGRAHDQGTLSFQRVHALAWSPGSAPAKIAVSTDAPTSTLGLLTISRISRSTATLEMTYAWWGVNPSSWTR